jgi:prolyl 4-hydroxylase
MTKKPLDATWQAWLQENLQRGCDRSELSDILLKHGFSPDSIQQHIAPKSSSILHGIKLKKRSYVDTQLYQQLSRITIAATDPSLDVCVVKSDQLQLFTIENFLSAPQCTELCNIIEKQLRPSTISGDDSDDVFRTSKTSDLANQQHPLIEEIDHKIANTLGLSLAYSEKIQAQKYDVGNEFKAHTDYFEPDTEEFIKYAAQLGQRTWTFMIYLNTTEAGGGTHFKAIDQVFYPQTGRAVIWNNLYADGMPNPDSIHHGMPVERGTKIIITKWFRNKGAGSKFTSSE